MAPKDLPTEIPAEPMEYLMNRAFKLRVIDYVCEHVPRMLKLRADQTLMIDYRRVVEYVEPNRDVPTLVEVPNFSPTLAPPSANLMRADAPTL